MARAIRTPEREYIDLTAREYERRGYQVLVDPNPAQIPDFLRGFRPDLIAYGNEENVVVEVKASDTLSHSRDIVSLADIVNTHPRWRFELIVTRPTRQDEAPDLDWWDIRHRLADARELLDEQESAATMLAWSAAEAAMRLLAKHAGVSLGSAQRNEPDILTKKLFTLGLLGREDYDVFAESIPLRNRAIHGYRSAGPPQDHVRRLIGAVEHLLAEIPSHPTP